MYYKLYQKYDEVLYCQGIILKYYKIHKKSFIMYIYSLAINKINHTSTKQAKLVDLCKKIQQKQEKIITFSKVLSMNQISYNQDSYAEISLDEYRSPSTCRKNPFLFQKQEFVDSLAHRRQAGWKMQERIKHLAFLHYNSNPSIQTEGKFSWQIFRKMATFIKTKNPNQCRIYHKRSLNRHKNVYNFISEIRKQVPELSEILAVYKEELFGIETKMSKQKSAERYLLDQQNPIKNKHQIIIENKIQVQNQKLQVVKQNIKIQDEKQKLDNLKTNITIQDKDIKEIKPRKSFQLPQIEEQPLLSHPFQNFQLTPTNIQQNNFRFFAEMSYAACLKPKTSEVVLSAQKQRVMRECHYLYLAYTSKLSQFMSLQ